MRLMKLADPACWRFHRQRRVTDLREREAIADVIARRMPHHEDRDVGDALSVDGYAMLPRRDAEAVAAMRDHFLAHEAFDPYRRDRGSFAAPSQVPDGTHVANYPDAVVAAAPHAFDIATDPAILAIAGSSLGCKPTITNMSAWWSIPSPTPAEHAELWHRDVDDYRIVKLFCYLTDVDDQSGPHGFVRGTHRDARLTTAGDRLPDEQVKATFGGENVVSFAGEAGTMFLENTYGVHRGFPPRSRPRLIFQVVYGQRRTIYSPKRPVARAAAGRDQWTSRLYYHPA